MDHPAVKLWRDRFKLNLSSSWKHDVEVTVTDLSLWKKILDGWGYRDAKGKWHRRAPGIKQLLDEYERLATTDEIAEKHNGEKPISDSDRPWLSKRRESDLSKVPSKSERLYF